MSKSSWILGFASDKWRSEQGSWDDTHIGGIPIWPPGLQVSVPPCPRCRAERQLVLQAYAPHQNHSRRVIYIFGCNSIVCSAYNSSWWAIRVCELEKPDSAKHLDHENERVIPFELTTSLCSNQADVNWDTESDSTDAESSDDIADDLELLSLQVELHAAKKRGEEATRSSSKQKESDNSSKASKRERPNHSDPQHSVAGFERNTTSEPTSRSTPFHATYVQVINEPQANESLVGDSEVNDLLARYMAEEKARAASGATEKWEVEHDDDESTSSQRLEAFHERISRAPGQILRYRFYGTPLWPSSPTPTIEVEQCNCGSAIAFELQLLGSCLHYLQPDKYVPENQSEAGMNFAALAIFTCSADCTKEAIVAENSSFVACSLIVCVQQDEW